MQLPITEPTPIQKEIWEKRFSFRDALCDKYPLFLHETPAANLPDIARDGLQARNPGTAMEDALIRGLGHASGVMLCLHPMGSFQVRSNKAGPFVLLAILPAVIPPAVTIDWSYANGWKLAEMNHQDCPHITAEQNFLDVMRRRGSVALLERILAQDLFVLCDTHSSLVWNPLLPTPPDILIYPDKGSQLNAIKAIPPPR